MRRAAIAIAFSLGLGSLAHAGGLLSYTDADLASAIDIANKATPPDTVGAGCFTLIRAGLASVGTGLPLSLKLATDIERLWQFHQMLVTLKSDTNCHAMCSRMGQILPLTNKIVPTICDAANLLR